MKKHQSQLLLCILATIFTIQFTSAVDFLLNGFASSDVLLYGGAAVESRILSFAKGCGDYTCRAFHSTRIPIRQPNTSFALPFSTSFIFSMSPYGCRILRCALRLSFLPHEHSYLNEHIFGVEFERSSRNSRYDSNVVRFDGNGRLGHEATGYWPDDHRKKDDGSPDEKSFKNLELSNGKNYQVWIDYADSIVNLTMAPAGMKRPKRLLLSVPLNLSVVFDDQIYVGFTVSTVLSQDIHRILAWSFSNTNFSLSEGLITEGLPSFEISKTPIYRRKGFTAGVTAGILSFAVVCSCLVAVPFVKRARRIRRERKGLEEWELEYWPHRLSYQEIETATKSFADENVIGIGGNGKVYRGLFPGGSEVAVKRISHKSAKGISAFSAEISSLGRLKHRNLVGLRGWCKKGKGGLILVYDYMENGSLDKRVFECDDGKMLSGEDRVRILKQVALGILYLHDGWESKVLHRDIKASNVLLDGEMNARLGDFGLARMHDHDKAAGTTQVVGTIGYLAPEIVRSGRASTQTDVFGYGVLILEVMCGRRPVEDGKPPLVDWVWQLFGRGELLNVIDARLRACREMDEQEAERVLHLGLLCAHPDPNARPTMRQVVKFFEAGKNESEEEGMDLYLLQKLKSREILSMYRQIVSPAIASHPKFCEKRQVTSSCNAISWSNTIFDGR